MSSNRNFPYTTSPDTIVSISSPIGKGAIGVFRLSGPEAHKIGSMLTGLKPENIRYRFAHYCSVKDTEGKDIDDSIVIFYKSPKSYTGEDMVEIFCHSGQAVLNSILETCIELGARIAEPGEFTRRAFLNGKLDLVQVEAVADIIEAQGHAALEAALRMRKGELSRFINEIREKLLFLISEFEAEIDFEEEELLETSDYQHRLEILKSIIHLINRAIENASDGIKIREGIKIAIAGKPNVGKSSLMNAIARKERAIVTPEPGTTRDIIEERVNYRGFSFIIADTAGIRESEHLAEAEGIRRAREMIREADIVFVVLDGSRSLEEEDIAVLEDIDLKKTVFILNKSDLGITVSKAEIMEALEKTSLRSGKHNNDEAEKEFERFDVVSVSAKTGENIEKLMDLAIEKAFKGGFPETDGILITNRRHLRHLKRAVEILNECINAIEQENIELSAFLLREASVELSRITGMITQEEILDDIFSRFCIGK